MPGRPPRPPADCRSTFGPENTYPAPPATGATDRKLPATTTGETKGRTANRDTTRGCSIAPEMARHIGSTDSKAALHLAKNSPDDNMPAGSQKNRNHEKRKCGGP